jgi:GTP-binding protein
MLIDDVKIKIIAGNGGKGAVAFDKNKLALGPAGGSGGKGGGVYFEAVSDLNALNQFRFKKELKAENGKDGRGQFCDGQDGPDLTLKVPVGTVIHNLDSKREVELTQIGQRIRIARGGDGGRGNFHFRSSKNTSPKEFEYGLPGQVYNLRLELKLIADIGFVGLPNVGKSSLLNELTNASAKVANYPFTTLEPNLGVYYDLILADIPGLIEGASSGKGLGIKFLRHVERTKILFHFISAESKSPIKDYKTIRKELGKYNKELLNKPEYLILSKTDVLKPKEIKEKIAYLTTKLNPPAGGQKIKIYPVSIYDYNSIEKIKKLLNKLAKKKSL